jgi:hypothetical protein
MSIFDWDYTYQGLLAKIIPDGDHWIVKDDSRKKQNNPIPISIWGRKRAINHWFAICRRKLDPSTSLKLKRLCDNQRCVKPDHWVDTNNRDDRYQLTHSNLMKNSVQSGDCRLWTSSINSDGYGMTSFNSKARLAHIVSLLVDQKLDEIPNNLVVRHKCTNKNCIAPQHLELGTHKENSQDRVRDQTLQIGSQHSNSTIDEIKALEIYKSNDGILTVADRAKKCNVSIHIVRSIDTGQCWNHITKLPRSQRKTKKIIIDENTDKEFFLKKQELIKKNSEEIYDEEKGETHWLWSLYKDKDNYGRTQFGNTTLGSHVMSWIAFNMKPVPEGHIICHKCINHKDCVNPDHLYAGTHRSNAMDRITDGTATSNATITKEKAEEIMRSKGTGSASDRARRFNVSLGIILSIDCGTSWKTLREELKIPITNNSNRISEQLAEQIMRSEGTTSEKAKIFGLPRETVHNIDMGRSWTKLRKKLNIPLKNGTIQTDIKVISKPNTNKAKIKLNLKQDIIYKPKIQLKMTPNATLIQTEPILPSRFKS